MRTTTLWLVFAGIMGGVYVLTPETLRVSAFALLGGVFGVLGTYLSIYENKIARDYPKLMAVLASSGFVCLVVSVLVQEWQ